MIFLSVPTRPYCRTDKIKLTGMMTPVDSAPCGSDVMMNFLCCCCTGIGSAFLAHQQINAAEDGWGKKAGCCCAFE